MLFTSWKFIVFLLIIIFLYPAIPGRFRRVYLLLASLFFYAGFGVTALAVLLGVNVLTYISGYLIGENDGPRSGIFRRNVLIISLVLIFMSLGLFKWSAFGLLLPVGMSFYIFTAAGYLIDVYKGKSKPERDPVTLSLFLCFFPNISSGPIERSDSLLPQIRNAASAKRPSFEQVTSGALAILWGYFLKLMIAERLAMMVDTVWKEYYLFGSVELMITAAFYMVQLYCDFSGYSLIATGAARMLGFELKENFHAPLLSRSFAEFWRRWHMSLMNWFRDYIYIPLGGSRKGYGRKLLNLMAVFVISGIWHGAGLNYPVWGFVCGLAMILCDVAVRKMGDKKAEKSAGGNPGLENAGPSNSGPAGNNTGNRNTAAAGISPGDPENFSSRLWKTALIFIFISLFFIFLRAGSLGEGLEYTVRLFTHFDPWVLFDGTLYELGLSRGQFAVLMPCLALMVFADLMTDIHGLQFNEYILRQGTWFRILVPALLFVAIMAYGVYGPGFDSQSFLYFNF